MNARQSWRTPFHGLNAGGLFVSDFSSPRLSKSTSFTHALTSRYSIPKMVLDK